MPVEIKLKSLEALEIGIFSYSLAPEEKFVSFNPAMAKIFSFSDSHKFAAKKFPQLFINQADWQLFLAKLNKEKKAEFFEAACLKGDKKVVWVMITATLLHCGRGKKSIEGIVQKIDSSGNGLHKVTREPDLLQTILDSIPDAIYFKDRKNRITRVNKFYADGFGGRLERIIGKTDFDFFPKEQALLMFSDDNQVIKTGKPIVGKIERTLLPNGTWNQVITTKVPMFDNYGKIIGTMGITRDMTPHANLERERYAMVLKALMVLGRALELRDPYTQTHARDVGVIVQKIAVELKLDEDKVTALKIAAELHDLGKIGIPLDILIKPGKLSDLEYSLIKEHTTNCYNLIKDIEFPFPLADIIYQHHERLDGSGYPHGIKGKHILKDSRILAVADVLEAMTHHRPYRAALGIESAIKELKAGSGKIYDTEIVDVTLRLIRRNKGQPFWQNKEFEWKA
ncbi:MAG: PAS domain-containing protein [Candidatus Omnitrophica bacterium]|nr:PAS domain-containing protein [Candidatus Omnitrophota bacterium]